jgi:hypothetical protein
VIGVAANLLAQHEDAGWITERELLHGELRQARDGRGLLNRG